MTTTYDDVSLRVRKGQYNPEDSPVDGTSPVILLELDCTAFVDAAQRAVLSPQEARALAHMLLAVTDSLSAASRG